MDHDIDRAISEVVAATAARCTAPTIAWGVRRAGEWLASGCFAGAGFAAPPTPASQIYRIASMTKSFTAATVLSLRDEGLLDLDDEAAAIADELSPVCHPEPGAGAITVRRLLSMTSGLATDDAWADRHLDISERDLLALYDAGLGFAARPGTVFEYSNLGYSMLGRVIKAVTGNLPQHETRRRLLDPLGLRRTGWDVPAHGGWAPPYRCVDGAAVADDAPLADGCIAPMGGLWSTLDDLAAWTDFFLDAWSPTPGSARASVLAASSRREMQHPHTFRGQSSVEHVDGTKRQIALGYGFGLNADHDPLLGLAVHHTGGLPGYGSNMRWLPERGVAVIALSNTTYAPMERLTRHLAERLDSLGVIPPPAPDARASVALRDAAERLVGLLNDWDDHEASALFADNVAPDEPLERRQAAARRFVVEHGRLAITGLRASRATSGTIDVAASGGAEVSIDIELSPHANPLIQLYAISLKGRP